MLLKDVIDDIRMYKKILIRRAKKSGLYDNFGEKEVKLLREKYKNYRNSEIWDAINIFSSWSFNLDLMELKQL